MQVQYHHIIARADVPTRGPRDSIDVVFVRLPRKEIVVEFGQKLTGLLVVPCNFKSSLRQSLLHAHKEFHHHQHHHHQHELNRHNPHQKLHHYCNAPICTNCIPT